MPRAQKPAPDFFNPQQAADLQATGVKMLESLSELGADVVAFVASRIKDDLQTQHDLMACRTSADLLHVQAQFLQRAINQYTAETGKIIALNSTLINELLHPAKE